MLYIDQKAGLELEERHDFLSREHVAVMVASSHRRHHSLVSLFGADLGRLQ